MKTKPIYKFALVLAAAGAFSLPASAAHASWFSRLFQADSSGTPQYTDTYNNHVDTIKGDMAPHANAPYFMQPGSLPQEAWEKLTPAQRDAYRQHMEAQKQAMHGHGCMPAGHMAPPPPMAVHHGDHHMDQQHHADWDKMTPAQKAEAKKRWEARKAEWEKMTPAQRETAKQRWQQEHGMNGIDGTPTVPDKSVPNATDTNKNMDPNMNDMR